MLSSAKSAHAERCSISPPGASMPAPAQLASPPNAPASRMVTRHPACARRHAMELPMIPAPITATSATRSCMGDYHRTVEWERRGDERTVHDLLFRLGLKDAPLHTTQRSDSRSFGAGAFSGTGGAAR